MRAWSVGKTLQGIPFDAQRLADLERLASLLGIACPLRQAHQIHGDRIDLDGSAKACDAFLVRPGQAALIRHADCFPVVVAAPSASLAIVAHCGWKGVHLDLAGKSVRELLSLGARNFDLVASIGPGIGPASFEVGPEVRSLFAPESHASTAFGTPSVDLVKVLVKQLVCAGVASDRIQSSAASDTFTDPKFHSHRRERDLAGRNATVCIVLHDPSQPEMKP